MSQGQGGKYAEHIIGVGDEVLPGDPQWIVQAGQVKCLQPAFLAGVEGPRLTAVEDKAKHALLVNSHLSIGGQQ